MSALKESFRNHYSNGWTHTFDKDIPADERKAWIEQTTYLAEEAGISFVFQEIGEEVEFVFPDQANWNLFAVIATAQDGGTGIHRYRHLFGDNLSQHHWTTLAQTLLDQAGIDYEVEIQDNTTAFLFDNIADRLVLTQLIESGLLDACTKAILDTSVFRRHAEELQSRLTEIELPGNRL